MQERVIDNTLSDQLAARAALVRSRLRDATHELHTRAERSGIVRELLRGCASRSGYALYLRSLLPAYRAMEQRLRRAPVASPLHMLADPGLYRSDALAADLAALIGCRWQADLPLLPEALAYGTAIAQTDDPVELTAHAYVRYMGDLSGGQVIAALLQRTLALPSNALTFHSFRDRAGLKRRVVHALGTIGDDETRLARLVHSACVAFELNIAVSAAVAATHAITGPEPSSWHR